MSEKRSRRIIHGNVQKGKQERTFRKFGEKPSHGEGKWSLREEGEKDKDGKGVVRSPLSCIKVQMAASGVLKSKKEKKKLEFASEGILFIPSKAKRTKHPLCGAARRSNSNPHDNVRGKIRTRKRLGTTSNRGKARKRGAEPSQRTRSRMMFRGKVPFWKGRRRTKKKQRKIPSMGAGSSSN